MCSDLAWNYFLHLMIRKPLPLKKLSRYLTVKSLFSEELNEFILSFWSKDGSKYQSSLFFSFQAWISYLSDLIVMGLN